MRFNIVDLTTVSKKRATFDDDRYLVGFYAKDMNVAYAMAFNDDE